MLVSLGRPLLFWITLALGVCVSLAVWPVNAVDAEAGLTRAGARLCYAHDGTLLIGVLLEGEDFGDEHLELASRVPSLQRLSVAAARISARSLPTLRSLPRLWNLNLSRTRLPPETLQILGQMSSLTELRLEDCDWVGDAELQHLQSLPRLETLSLAGTDISPNGLRPLSALPSLRFLILDRCSRFDDTAIETLIELAASRRINLCLSGTEITAAGLSRLQRALPNCLIHLRPETMVGLRHLAGRGTFITRDKGQVWAFRPRLDDDGLVIPLEPGDLSVIGKLDSLVELNLERTQVDDRMFEELGDLPNLEVLRLTGTRITDAGLKVLARFPNLTTLWLLDTDLEGPGLAAVSSLTRLRNLRVVARSPGTLTDVLATLPELEVLTIQAPLQDPDFARLAACRSLRSLSLVETQIGGQGLAALQGLESLVELRIDGGRLEDADVESLFGLPALRWVSLDRTGVTWAGRERIVTRRPDLRLQWSARETGTAGTTTGQL